MVVFLLQKMIHIADRLDLFLCLNAAAKISINFDMHKKSREKVHFFPTILIDITDFSRSSTFQPFAQSMEDCGARHVRPSIECFGKSQE